MVAKLIVITVEENNDILKELQANFRKGYNNMGHIYVLKYIIDLFIYFQKRKLCCSSVDYNKAFDTIETDVIWHKVM